MIFEFKITLDLRGLLHPLLGPEVGIQGGDFEFNTALDLSRGLLYPLRRPDVGMQGGNFRNLNHTGSEWVGPLVPPAEA